MKLPINKGGGLRMLSRNNYIEWCLNQPYFLMKNKLKNYYSIVSSLENQVLVRDVTTEE